MENSSMEKAKATPCVYVMPIPTGSINTDVISCDARREYIEQARSQRLRRERFFAWRLLEYALLESLGIKASELEFTKNADGSWHAEGVEFSISHTDGAVAVAVFTEPVGVDIEAKVRGRVEFLIKKALTERERQKILSLPKEEQDVCLIALWSMKESIFKASGTGVMKPSEIETDGRAVWQTVKLFGREYVLSLCADGVESFNLKTVLKL